MTAALILHPAASRHAFRAQVCRLVDRLIAMLDDIDGDADLEPAGDEEPSLSFTEPGLYIGRDYHVLSQVKLASWLPNDADDREEEDEHDEPNLSGVTVGPGSPRDLEHGCDDEGFADEDDDQVDGEPSLCGTIGTADQHAVGGQTTLFRIDTIDLEDQCDDEGHDSDREPSLGGIHWTTTPADEEADRSWPETGEHGQ